MIRPEYPSVAGGKLTDAWQVAVKAQTHPCDAMDRLFRQYPLVDRGVQFSEEAVPEGEWFVDWGRPRKRYGAYQVVESHHYGQVLPSKLAPALCPECRDPIFTVMLPNGDGRRRIKQLCLSCGHWEFSSLPR